MVTEFFSIPEMEFQLSYLHTIQTRFSNFQTEFIRLTGLSERTLSTIFSSIYNSELLIQRSCSQGCRLVPRQFGRGAPSEGVAGTYDDAKMNACSSFYMNFGNHEYAFIDYNTVLMVAKVHIETRISIHFSVVTCFRYGI